MATRRETELYGPVKQFFEQRGFEVKGEVNGCDVVAVNGDETIIVELKAAFNLALVLQGIDRQRLTEAVYLAVEAPRNAGGRWRELVHLCRRLGLGLLTVSFRRREPGVEVVCDSEPVAPRRSTAKRTSLLREFQRRSADHNAGGSAKRPLVTAYREDALRAAQVLREKGPSPTGAVREATGNLKVTQLLQQDVYGWFQRVSRGVYGLTPKGEEALERYADIVAQL